MKEVGLAEITTIGRSAFNGCFSLEVIRFPPTLVSIDHNAFARCRKLREVDLTNSNTSSIGHSAFEGCVALRVVKLPSSFTTINRYTFRYCYIEKGTSSRGTSVH